MIDRSVGAVRKFRERGMLTPIPHRIKGKLMFTKDAVAALATHLEVRANVPIERRSEATTPLTVHLHYTDEHHAEEVAVPTDFRSERGAFRPRT